MNWRRLIIPLFVAFLAILLTVMGRNLLENLDALSTAGDENAQWTILQLDTEFANLHATLLEAAERPEVDRDSIRLRTNIALSRIIIVGGGVAGEIIRTDKDAEALLQKITNFADQAIPLVEGDLDSEDIARLTELTAVTAPLARALALKGVQIGAVRTEAHRKEIARKLRNSGLVAICVIGVLGAVLVMLNRLLSIAREKDKDLRASSKRFESTISGSLDAIVTSNENGDILDFNPAAEKVFDWKKTEMVGVNVGILLPKSVPNAKGPSKKQSGNDFEKYIDQGRCEIMARRRTGDVFPADLTVTSVGKYPEELIIVYLRDISDRKINEQALVDAKERAERTDRAKSQFLTVMSHEMRTPLSGVLGVLDLLRMTKLSEKQRRYVDVAAASSELLMQHLHEGLDIARIETGSLTFSPQRFNLAEEVVRIATILDPLAKEKGIELVHRIDSEMHVDFLADGNRIGQIITNIVGNAIKFTNSGSVEICVSGIHSKAVTSATVSVRDTGIGIPAEYSEAIFEDFVALSHSRGRMSRGDGLGLSISRKIARLMSGDITVSSVEGSGSEFKLKLPLSRAEELEAASRTRKAPGARSVNGKPMNILIVEDNNINRTVLKEMIEAMGHVASVAADGQEGYLLAQKRPFDVIFMDINMPVMDGIELTKKLREGDGPNRATDIQGLTAYGREEFLHIAEKAGMNGFSTKPLRVQDIAGILYEGQTKHVARGGNSADIDEATVQELRAALGDARFNENADKFFSEAEEVLNDLRHLKLSDEREEIAMQLHRLGGAAALFGLRALADAVLSTRAEVENETTKPLKSMLDELDNCAQTTRISFRALAR